MRDDERATEDSPSMKQPALAVFLPITGWVTYPEPGVEIRGTVVGMSFCLMVHRTRGTLTSEGDPMLSWANLEP